MSELKSFIVLYDGKFIRAYNKSEADKVIAEKDKEIARLKDSIGKLLKAKTEQVMDEVFQRCIIYGDGFVPVEHAMRLVAELRHQKYKRCLAMAEKCEAWIRLDVSPRHTHRFIRWYKIWLKLAEKFKEAK